MLRFTGGRDQLLQARGGEVQEEGGGGQEAEGQAAGGAGEHPGAAQPAGVEIVSALVICGCFLFNPWRFVYFALLCFASALCVGRNEW